MGDKLREDTLKGSFYIVSIIVLIVCFLFSTTGDGDKPSSTVVLSSDTHNEEDILDNYIELYEQPEYNPPLQHYIAIKDTAANVYYKREHKKRMAKLEKKREEKKEELKAKRKARDDLAQLRSVEEKTTFNVTNYIAECRGCSGTTASGFPVHSTIYYKGMRILASDNNRFPLYSIIQLNVNGNVIKGIVLDRGSAINGNDLDLLVSSKSEALSFGVQTISGNVLRYGKGE